MYDQTRSHSRPTSNACVVVDAEPCKFRTPWDGAGVFPAEGFFVESPLIAPMIPSRMSARSTATTAQPAIAQPAPGLFRGRAGIGCGRYCGGAIGGATGCSCGGGIAGGGGNGAPHFVQLLRPASFRPPQYSQMIPAAKRFPRDERSRTGFGVGTLALLAAGKEKPPFGRKPGSMLRAIAVQVFAAAVFAVATPEVRAQPAPTASGAPALPEIGRTRATTAACAVMRDIVIPSFSAARGADARFDAVRAGAPRYIQLKSDYNSQRVPVKSDGIMLESAYNRLSIDTASLLRDTDALRKLLDDPRISASSSDPTVRAEREQLELVYAAQQARANALSELMQRESTYLSKHMVGWEDPAAFSQMNVSPSVDTPSRPAPAITAHPGMPLLTGFDAADRARLSEWGAALTRMVHASEEQAAKTFLPLAQGCR